MTFLSYPPVYFLPHTWQSPGVDYPFPIIQTTAALIGLSIAAWFIVITKSKGKWD